MVLVQDARIQRVLEFLKAPSQLSDKDLAAKVLLYTFLMPASLVKWPHLDIYFALSVVAVCR